MKKLYLLLLLLSTGCTAATTAGNPPTPAPCDPALNETARLLAGLPASLPQDNLAAFRAEPAWQNYSTRMNGFWSQIESRVLQPVSDWRRVVPAWADSRIAFYPLSGADFLNFYAMFPNNREYIMLALEPCGDVPRFESHNPVQRAGLYNTIMSTIPEYGSMNYFMTHIMQQNMNSTPLSGVTPMIMIFMARMKLNVCAVEYCNFSAKGELVVLGTHSAQSGNVPAGTNAVRFSFRDQAGANRTLLYMYAKLDDELGLARTPQGKYLASRGQYATMMKSAIYFMHYDWISQARRFVLEKSDLILQDDSGVPYRFFDQNIWQVDMHGQYDPRFTLTNAKVFQQTDLLAVWPKDNAPLPFHFGYGVIINKSSIQIAKRRSCMEN